MCESVRKLLFHLFLVVCIATSCGIKSSIAPPISLDLQQLHTTYCPKLSTKAHQTSTLFTLGWPMEKRVDLHQLSQQGMVFINYHDCQMTLLPQCNQGQPYQHSQTPANQKAISIQDHKSLYAELPLGAAAFAAHMAHGETFILNYVMTAKKYLPSTAYSESNQKQNLSAQCPQATHYIQDIYLGALQLESKQSHQGKLGHILAKGKQHKTKQTLDAIGDFIQCTQGKKQGLQSNILQNTKQINNTDVHCQGIIKVKLATLRSHTTTSNTVIEQVGKSSRSMSTHPVNTTHLVSSSSVKAKSATQKPIIKMIKLPAGQFMMGSDHTVSHESPQHRVKISAFYMSQTEITVAQYKACVNAAQCTKPDTHGGCNWSVKGREEHPVNCVDWYQAKSFARWMNATLPSEAQWEYAARGQGSNTHLYAGSNEIDDVAIYLSNSHESTHAVAQRSPNHYGLYDMSGNVYEWVLDHWHSNYHAAPTQGQAWLTPGGTQRVLRGGSWNQNAQYSRVTHRRHVQANQRLSDLGFRIVRAISTVQ